MASSKNPSTPASAADREAPAPRLPGDAPAQDRPSPPRAGRSGGMGSRAERPSEGGKGSQLRRQAGRGAKAPNATGTAAARESSASLPQPARDSTA